MRLKTALELLGHDREADVDCLCAYCDLKGTLEMLEEVAQRSREEAYEMAANELDACGFGHCLTMAARIRELPTEPNNE